MNQSWLRFLPKFIRIRLEGRENLQKILGNTGWLVGEKILRMVLGLFVGVWVARYLGPEQFGVFNYLLAFVLLFSPVAKLGMEDIVVRNLVQDSSQRNNILGTSFVLMFTAGILAMILAIGTAMVLQTVDTNTTWLLAITTGLLVFQSFDNFDFWFRSQVNAKPAVIVRSIVIVIIAGFNIGLIITHASLDSFVWVRVSELALFGAGLYLAYCISEKTVPTWHFDMMQAITLLRDSWPLILSGFAGVIYLRIDQVMLTNIVSKQENGIYAAAVRLVELWYFVPMAIYASVFPKIVESKSISETLFYERLQKLYNVMSFLAYFIAIPTTIFAEWIVTIVFGKDYYGAVPILIIMIWSMMFTNLGLARSAFLMSNNLITTHTFTVVLGAIVNILLNLWLLPRYGGTGAAIATLVSYWIATHGSCFLYKPLFKTGNMLTRAILYPKIW